MLGAVVVSVIAARCSGLYCFVTYCRKQQKLGTWNMHIGYRRSVHIFRLCEWIVLLFCCKWITVHSRVDATYRKISRTAHSFNATRQDDSSSAPSNIVEPLAPKVADDYVLLTDGKRSLPKNFTYITGRRRGISRLGEIGQFRHEKREGNASNVPNDYIPLSRGASYKNLIMNMPGFGGFDGACESRPEHGRRVWVGSQTATLHWKFRCFAIRCFAECANSHPSEEWSCRSLHNGTLEVNGKRLSRNKDYKCKIVALIGPAIMIHGIDDVSFRTLDGKPYPPGAVEVSNITSTSFVVYWEPSPHIDKEPVDFYTLNVYKEIPRYPLNTACGLPVGQIMQFNTTKTNKLVTGLLPYYKHRVYVYAYNQFGHDTNTLTEVTTSPSDPGGCENATLHQHVGPEGEPAFTITWTEPCYWNGPPRETSLLIKGHRPDKIKRRTRSMLSFPARQKTSMEPSYSNSYTYNAFMDFNYTVELHAHIAEKDIQPTRSEFWNFYIPPGLASVTSQWQQVRPEVLVRPEDESFQVNLPLNYGMLNETNGTVKHVAVMVAEKGYEGERQRQYLPLPNWPDERDWHSATQGDHIQLYQATPKYYRLSMVEDNKTHQFRLGADSCRSMEPTTEKVTEQVSQPAANKDDTLLSFVKTSTNAAGQAETSTAAPPTLEKDHYCNGPLRKNVEYTVRLRVFTNAGYADSIEINFLTGSNGPKPFYSQLCYYAAFPTILAAAVLVLMWIRRYRRRSNAVASAPSPGHKQSSCSARRLRKNSRRRSVSPEKLPKIATRFLSQKTNLEKEFEELNEISAAWAAKVCCSVGRLQENRLKNRYADVIPYDYNRVKLSSESTSHTDYINASFIQGFSLNVEYIACQGPTMETSNDFWQMVFDQNISLIIMLTSLVENGMAKCFQYFSELCENKEWMDFSVKCTSRQDLTNYTTRELELYKKTTQQRRLIKHFQFRDWPDFGCPSDIDGILEFCDVLRGNCCLRSYSTAVVHCSAGIGRTGTLIALDILLQYVHYNRKMDVMRTVLRLREQRQWMVRTVEQYAFLYRCLKTAAERHFSSVI